MRRCTVQVHRLTALPVQILGNLADRAPTAQTQTNTISDLVETRDELVHGNVHRAGDSASPPLVLSANVNQRIQRLLADLVRSLRGETPGTSSNNTTSR